MARLMLTAVALLAVVGTAVQAQSTQGVPKPPQAKDRWFVQGQAAIQDRIEKLQRRRWYEVHPTVPAASHDHAPSLSPLPALALPQHLWCLSMQSRTGQPWLAGVFACLLLWLPDAALSHGLACLLLPQSLLRLVYVLLS